MAFDFSTLITDRSPEDLQALRDLLTVPMSDWTAEQLAEFNRAVSKGAYNYTDLNRVIAAMDDINERLTAAGYVTGYQKIEVPHKAESGGLPAVTEYRYLRMTITAIRGSGSTVQLSEIKLEDSDNGLDFTWPVTTTVTSSIQAVSNEPAQNLIDGSTSTKFCSTAFSSGATLTIDLGEGNHVDLGLYNTWQWYTANDEPGRDPISFSLDVSNDGTHWLSVDSVSDANITETREALAYSGSITLPTFTRVAYIESSGTEYIDTGITPSESTRIDMDVQPLSTSTCALFGARAGVGNAAFALWVTSSTSIEDDYGTARVSVTVPSVLDRVSIQKNKNVLQYGSVTNEISATTFNSGHSLTLFAINSAGTVDSRRAPAITYSVSIYDNDVLVREMYPCKASTGDIGMLDTVCEQFYPNDGTGAFSAGDVIPEDMTSELDPYLWYEQDVPTTSIMMAYLSNVAALRNVIDLPEDLPEIPVDMASLTQEEANNIEVLLSIINDYLEALLAVFRRCGFAVCGGPGLYPIN